jgi:dolichol kinase
VLLTCTVMESTSVAELQLATFHVAVTLFLHPDCVEDAHASCLPFLILLLILLFLEFPGLNNVTVCTKLHVVLSRPVVQCSGDVSTPAPQPRDVHAFSYTHTERFEMSALYESHGHAQNDVPK